MVRVFGLNTIQLKMGGVNIVVLNVLQKRGRGITITVGKGVKLIVSVLFVIKNLKSLLQN